MLQFCYFGLCVSNLGFMIRVKDRVKDRFRVRVRVWNKVRVRV